MAEWLYFGKLVLYFLNKSIRFEYNRTCVSFMQYKMSNEQI